MNNEEWLNEVEREMNGPVEPETKRSNNPNTMDLQMSLMTDEDNHIHRVVVSTASGEQEIFAVNCDIYGKMISDLVQFTAVLILNRKLDEGDKE